MTGQQDRPTPDRETLERLYSTHRGKVSDKWSSYLTEYERLFAEYRTRPVRLLEIGVQNGGSLEIWSRYFPVARAIVGCDIDPACGGLSFDDPRISVVVGDANSDSTQQAILARGEAFDIIIDDGSHCSDDIIRAFALYYPHLESGGVFVVEDLHASYWQEYGGGLYDPFSAISFFKRLTDVINHEHWGIQKPRSDVLRGLFAKYGFKLSEEDLETIHSVEFTNSLCIVRKSTPESNKLDRRVIAGSVATVWPEALGLHSLSPPASDQTGNEWTARSMPPDEELPVRARELEEKECEIASLDERVKSLGANLKDRDERITGLQNQILSLQAKASGLSDQIQNMQSGIVMGLMRHYGHILDAVAPRGTRRRHYYELTTAGMRVLLNEGWRSFLSKAKKAVTRPESSDIADPYRIWIANNEPDEAGLELQKRDSLSLKYRPKISVIMPVWDTDEKCLTSAIVSVMNQTYDNWELCLADSGSTEPHVKEVLQEYAEKDARIKLKFLSENKGISSNSNEALSLATGEFVSLLDHDDELAPFALYECVGFLNERPETDFIYSDEDKISEGKKRSTPFFKPDWSPDMFLSWTYTGRFVVYRKTIVDKVGGFRQGYDGAESYDLTLRCTEITDNIGHIAKVLYHSRDGAGPALVTSEAYAAGRKALGDYLTRNGIKGEVKDGVWPGSYRIKRDIIGHPLVSIILPTKNNPGLLKTCVESIVNKTDYDNYEILIVDNHSTDPAVDKYCQELKDKPRIRLLHYDHPFNFSLLNNWAAGQARGDYLLFLNDDTDVISAEWMSAMLEHCQRKEVGVVGALLLYLDGTIQHCGVIVGAAEDHTARHALRHRPMDSQYFGNASVIRGYSAVTGACMMLRRQTFWELNGLDGNMAQDWNDVDLCLKARQDGYLVVYTPYARLHHLESYTRGSGETPRKWADKRYFLQRWAGAIDRGDPYYSPNLVLETETPDFQPRPGPSRKPGDVHPSNLGMAGADKTDSYARIPPVTAPAESSALEQIDGDTETLKASLRKKQSRIIQLEMQVAEQDAQLSQLRSALGVQLLARYARFVNTILPSCTKRRRLYDLSMTGTRVILTEGWASFFKKARFWLRLRKATPPKTRMSLPRFNAGISPKEAQKLTFPMLTHDPKVSIVIPAYNKWQYTLNCLKSVAENTDGDYEVVVVDDASSDDTVKVLGEIQNLRLLRNEQNSGFVETCNRGAKESRGQYILFLNNDTMVTKGWLASMLTLIERDDIGAVGSKLVYADGTLQEAGSIIWNDGSALGYGRGDDPQKPEYGYVREVDYCSGASLLVKRELFEKVGGFDQRFKPGYYEDTDLCLSIRNVGFKVVFQPASVVVHFEGITNGTDMRSGVKRYQEINRPKFVAKWSTVLQKDHCFPDPRNVLLARDKSPAKRILVIDDRIPTPSQGTGYPRAYNMLKFIRELGYAVTLYPLVTTVPWQPETAEFQQLGVEVFYGESADLAGFAASRRDHYELVLVSRPHNMQNAISIVKRSFPRAAIIYDAEAVYSVRDMLKARLRGDEKAERGAVRRIDDEIALMNLADAVTMVSESERTLVSQKVKRDNLVVWGHPMIARGAKATFSERKDVLFVGGFLSPDSPNEDAILYFCREIFTQVQKELSCRLLIAGANPPDSVKKLSSFSVVVAGFVEDLTPYYEGSRIFVVPHRYSAGIPWKLQEAMSYGVPCVVSALTASQLGLKDGKEALVAESPEEFRQKVIRLYQLEELWCAIQKNALDYIRQECNPDTLKDRLKAVLEKATDGQKHGR